MSDQPRKPRGKPRPKATVRVVVHLPVETVKQIGIACTMEQKSRRAWLAEVIAERAKRYVVQDRGRDEAA